MDKLQEDQNGLQLWVFEKFIFVVCNVWYNALEVYLLNKKLWFCRLQVISLLRLSSIPIKEA